MSPNAYAYPWSCPWSGCSKTFSTSSELLTHNEEIHRAPLQEAYLPLTLPVQQEDSSASCNSHSTNTKNTNSQICVISGCAVSFETESDLTAHYKKIHGIVLASSRVSSRHIAAAPDSGQISKNAPFVSTNLEDQAKPNFDQVSKNTKIPSAKTEDQKKSSTAGRPQSKKGRFQCGEVRLDTGAICVESFTTQTTLNRHQNGQAHNPNTQRYTCGEVRLDTGVTCVESFTSKTDLNRHQNGQAHNPNTQRYTCGEVRLDTGVTCVESFAQQYDLRKHQNGQAHNPNSQEYACDLCNAVYQERDKLLRHKKRWHCTSQI